MKHLKTLYLKLVPKIELTVPFLITLTVVVIYLAFAVKMVIDYVVSEIHGIN